MELLIRNGKIINAGGSITDKTATGDVLIRNGVIADVGVGLDGSTADRVIDADGLFVLPGAIDAHTHLEMKMGKTFSADGYESGTRAAACGGVTTVFDYTLQENGKSMLAEIEDRNRLACGKACVDYAFHGGISEVSAERLAELFYVGIDGPVVAYEILSPDRVQDLVPGQDMLLVLDEI